MLLSSHGVTKDVDPKLCVTCKGRLFCGLQTCPILDRVTTIKRVEECIDKNHFEGPSPPSVFIGKAGYPNVSAGPMNTPIREGDPSILDDPTQWYGLPREEIIGYRESLVRSSTKAGVNQAANPDSFITDLQDLAMSKRFVDLEVEFYGRPKFTLSVGENSPPIGPTARLKNMELTESPSIPKQIEKVTSDTDLLAKEAISFLYGKGFDVHRLSNVLSTGALGVKSNRKLVPTRWSITAIDSMLSQELIDEVKQFPLISDYLVFHSKYLDNNFYVILLPMTWAFEQLEAWSPGSIWYPGEETVVIKDAEFGKNRKTYASNVSGAYYACRLAVTEYLKTEKKQAGALIWREIGKGYDIPLGVWQCRENVRHALMEKPMRFSSKELMWKHLSQGLEIPLETWGKNSDVLRFFKEQRRLFEYF